MFNPKILLTSIFFLVILAQTMTLSFSDQPMIIHPPTISMDSSSMVNIRYAGEKDVYVVLPQLPKNFTVESAKVVGEKVGGLIIISAENMKKAGIFDCSLAFFSTAPYNLNVSLLKGNDVKPISQYICPANITVQLNLVLALNLKEPVPEGQIFIQQFFMNTFSRFASGWEFAVYLIFIPLFMVTGFLNLHDMKRKKEKWTKQDSVALILRHVFYAFLFCFIIVSIVSLGLLVYSYIFKVSLFSFGVFIFSALLFALIGLIYWLAKWRNWYDLIDEED
ncbi:MAG: hypothetical protein B6U77_00545 [Candidatus Hecatellales archaeon ex4484_218]|nr:MAG: hypothetical protein B6U77_00545 [Candidatus Hecatellales archaeon ex4484_218]